MQSLLTIAPPETGFPRETMDASGGFVWWYLDAFDQNGNGIVLIWSFGLPFLPGYASSARRGAAPRASERPSLNVSVYRDGALDFYSLQEFAPSDCEWGNDTWRFGSSTMQTEVRDGRRVVRVNLDVAVPGDDELRLQGDVTLRGVARRSRPSDAYEGRHDWAPMTGPSHTTVALATGATRYELEARGYFDGNCGLVPLADTGIYEWTWGRAPFPDRELVYYILWRSPGSEPEAHGIEISEDGTLVTFPIEVQIPRRGRALAGMRYPSRLVLRREGTEWLRVSSREILDDGPFYLRYFQEFDDGSTTVHGKGEICRTDRIDLGLHRPLVQMRVERVGSRNSMWLPLFTGPREGRVRRLFTQFVGGSRG